MRGWTSIPNWLLDNPDLTHRDKIVYLTLASYLGRDGVEVWPTQETLAARTGISDRTIRRCIVRLAEAGAIQVRTVPCEGGVRNYYTLLIHPRSEEPPAGVIEAVEQAVGEPIDPPSDEGGADTGVRRGADTGVRVTRSISNQMTSTQQSLGSTSVEPDTHPQRKMTPDWLPSPRYAMWLQQEYPGIDHRESCARFVRHYVAAGMVSRSWEAMLANWISRDRDRHVEQQRSGTDDRGVPLRQGATRIRTLQPGDDGYVSDDDLIAEAVRSAALRPPRRPTAPVSDEQPPDGA